MRRRPNGPSTISGPNTTVVPGELGVEVVGEQGGVEEPFGGQGDGVLVDRAGEQRDLHRARGTRRRARRRSTPSGRGSRPRRVRSTRTRRRGRRPSPPGWPSRSRPCPGTVRGQRARRPLPSRHDGDLEPSDDLSRQVGGAPGVHTARAALRPVLRRRDRAGGVAAAPRGQPRRGRQRGRELPVGVLRHLVGVDELHLVRVGVRQRRRRVPRPGVHADDRGAGPRGRCAARVHPSRLRHRVRRLPRHARGIGHAVAACRAPRSRASPDRAPLRRGRVADDGRVGCRGVARLAGVGVLRDGRRRAVRGTVGGTGRCTHPVAP